MIPRERAACLLLLLLLLPAYAAADQYVGGIPLVTEAEGVVSGGVYVNSFVGVANERDVTKTFTLPKYTTIKWARLYTSVYCAHMQNNYEHRATVQFDGGSGMRTLGVEDLRVEYSFPANEGTGPVWVNDHCNRVTSDYLMWYDVTSAITKGTVTAHVKTEQPEGFKGTFDGRIKIVTLVVAYDDGDGDEVYYWVNQGHDVHSYYVEEYLGETYEGETTFATTNLPDEDDEREPAAELSVVYMASQVGEFSFNGEDLDANPPQGAYSGYQSWDVTAEVSPEKNSELTYTRDMSVTGSGGGYLGAFFKIPLAVLAVKYPAKEVGGLTVTSFPAGATVFLDDEQTQWVTNVTINGIAAGDHMVRVELDRYRIPDDRSVEVKKGANVTVHFNLQPITGSIEVTSDPSGAWVYLDGGKYHNENMSVRTPATLSDLIVGDYTVEVRLGGQSSYKTVTVLEDETVVVDLAFGSSGGDSDGSVPDYGYTGMPLKTYQTGTIHGNVSYYPFSSYTGLIHAGESREFSMDIPSNGTVGLARLYIYTTWGHDEKEKKGKEQRITLKVDGIAFPADKVYGDRKNEGVYDYLLETFAYNVTGMKGGVAGTHTVTVTNDGRKDDVFATYGVGVLVVTEDPSLPEITYWIDEGSDTIYANPDFGTTSDDCITTMPFDGTIDLAGTGAARLILIATAGSGEDNDEHRITFNDGEWFNLLTAGSSAISVAELNVRPYLAASGNLAGIQSYITTTKGDYMENRGAVLVVSKGEAVTGETGALASETETSPRPSTGSTMRVALNESAGRLEATRLLSDDGAFEVFVPEGTVIVDGAGKRVTVLTLKSAWAGDAWTCTVGDEDMQADIPLLLIVHTDRLSLSGTFSLRGPDGQTVETTTGEGDLSARIVRGGVYTLVAGGKEQPEKTVFDRVSDFFGGIVTAFLGIFGVPAEEKVVSVERNETVPAAVGTIVPVATEKPIDISSMTFAVSLLSNPPGALVDLDGTYLGKTTPVTVTAAGGDHTVRMRLEGADPVERTIHLSHDDELALDFEAENIRDQQFDLDSLRAWDANRYGGVYVESYPAGAEIYVDGKKTGRKTPWTVYGLKEGLHSIKAKLGKVTFVSEKESVWVNKNTVSSVTFMTGPEEIGCSISVDGAGLSGCPFSVNGRYLGYKLPKTVDVGGGINRYVTVCVNGSYISERVSDFMESNETLMIRKDTPAPCSVMVTSKPAGAEIFVDGFATGAATPYCVGNLSAGRHLISVSKPGYTPAERTVVLAGSGTSGPDANVDLKMDPYAYGSLTVESTPSSAKIYLFGKDTGEKTPFTFYYIPMGSYDVKVVGKNGSKTIPDVVVGPYQNTECEVDLSKQ